MVWKVEFDPRAEKELAKLDRWSQKRIIKFLRARIQTGENPRRIGSALHGDNRELWKYRVRDHRLIVDIQDSRILVLVLRVGHRHEIYR